MIFNKWEKKNCGRSFAFLIAAAALCSVVVKKSGIALPILSNDQHQGRKLKTDPRTVIKKHTRSIDATSRITVSSGKPSGLLPEPEKRITYNSEEVTSSDFNCLKCDPNSIPLAGFQEKDDEVAFRSLHVDANGQHCATCMLGAFPPKQNTSTTEEDSGVISRQIIQDKHYSCIYILGSSIQRQMFLNFVESFRKNHNFTHHHLIEHYFHQSARYVWNGTHDGFFIMDKDHSHNGAIQTIKEEQGTILNSTAFVEFIWDPKVQRIAAGQEYSCPSGGKKLLVLGNTFWVHTFHDGYKAAIQRFLQQSTGNDSLIWLDAWNRKYSLFSELRESGFHIFNEDLLMNKDSSDWFTNNRETLNKVNVGRINLDNILERDYGKEIAAKIFRGFIMREDKKHAMCNFRQQYPNQITRISNHKRQTLGNCTDLINDLLWKEIDKFLH